MANPEQAEVNMSDDSSDKPRDTEPAPPPGVDPNMVEAFAEDVANLADSLDGAADSLRALATSMRREAASATR